MKRGVAPKPITEPQTAGVPTTSKGSKEKMYTAHSHILLFKDNRFRSQVPTVFLPLPVLPIPFQLELRIPLYPENTDRPFIPAERPQQRNPNLLVTQLQPFSLFRVDFLYFTRACCTVVMFERRDTNMVMSSVYVETFASSHRWSTIPSRTGFALLSLILVPPIYACHLSAAM